MRPLPLLALCCVLECCVGVALAVCTVSKYEEGPGERVQCSNVDQLSKALNQGNAAIAALMIFGSPLQEIPAQAFLGHAQTLRSINIHQCGLHNIDRNGFAGLFGLKKLALPNNNLTEVREGWFKDLPVLEHLDLSYNRITKIEPFVLNNLRGLRRLDIAENRLTCFDPAALQPMGGLDKFRFAGNPLAFRCRGTLTLWLRDHGVIYDHEDAQAWLDDLLWGCSVDDSRVADSEILMKECVILNLFNQLLTGLTTTESYPPAVAPECGPARDALTKCVASTAEASLTGLTNGNMIKRLLYYFQEARSAS